MPEVFKVILGKFKSFFIRHIKCIDAFTISNNLAQNNLKRVYFYIKLLKQKHTCIHGENQIYINEPKIVISDKILNIHKYANEIK
jgi:hypothetical protein